MILFIMDAFCIEDHCSNYVTSAVMSAAEVPTSMYKYGVIRQKVGGVLLQKILHLHPATADKTTLLREAQHEHFTETSAPHKKRLITRSQPSFSYVITGNSPSLSPLFLLGTFAIKTVLRGF